MKKIKLVSIMIIAIIFMLAMSQTAFAGSISSINGTLSNGKITVTGTTSSGVLAAAIVVYSGENVVYMETCEVSNDNKISHTLNHQFEDGTYTVKVADYNGGDYATIEVSSNPNAQSDSATEEQNEGLAINEIENANTQTTEVKKSNPKTGDNIAIFVTLFISSCLGIGIVDFKKNKIRNNK